MTFPRAYSLLTNGRTDPIGIPDPSPVLTWKVQGSSKPDAYIVHAASSLERLRLGKPDVLNMALYEQGPVPWPGQPLTSRTKIWWRVGVLCNQAVTWSRPGTFEAPLWSMEEWEADAVTHAAWVTPAEYSPGSFPELRTTFNVTSPVTTARLYVTGPGITVSLINDAPAITAQLETGYSTLAKGVPATAWDVTSKLKPGQNSLGFTLGGGIAYLPNLENRYTKFTKTNHALWVRARLEIMHEDGHTTVVASNQTWDARLGNTRVAHWYGGEDYDATASSDWGKAIAVPAALPSWWRTAPPIQVTETLTPVSVNRRLDGSRILDFGINTAGRPVLRATGQRPGNRIVITPAEVLDTAGLPDQSTTGMPIWDSHVAGPAATDWHPSFVYHGSRYLQVSGMAPEAPDGSVSIEVMRTANAKVGSFGSSDPFLSRLHTIIDRAVQSNMYSVFTDCPHREKLGWLEQLYLCFNTMALGYDVQAHLSDAVRHMIDSQTANGLVPATAPELVIFDSFAVENDITAFRDDPNWGRALIEVPWLTYLHYGDTTLLKRAQTAGLRYLEYLESRSVDNVLDFGLGDWIALDGSTPRAMVATHGWAQALQTAAQSAHALGQRTLASSLQEKCRNVWEAFSRHFFDSRTKTWGSGSQGSWALAWSAPDSVGSAPDFIVDGLLSSIEAAGMTLTVGENSLSPFIRALTDSGHADTLNALIRREDAPGYGHQLASGATALTESWRGPSGDEGVASQNHFMLGAIDDWIIGDVVGLRQAPQSIGWSSIIVKPNFLQGTEDATATFDSPRGEIAISWVRRHDGNIRLEVRVPPTVECQVVVPDEAEVEILSANRERVSTHT